MAAMNGLAFQACGLGSAQRIVEAAEALDSARQTCSADHIVDARAVLRAVVQAANDDGLSWQSIGDLLGIRRGAAYQRFRRRPCGTAEPT
jgi:hypothetical protein